MVAGLICLALAALPLPNPLVSAAKTFNARVAAASGTTYVSLRVINAALSVAQEVEVGGSFGVSANAQPMKWLEPIDDTVERVSSLVFVVAVVSGVLALAFGPVAAIGFGLIGIALLARCGCDIALAGKTPPRGLRRGVDGMLTMGLVLALLLPGGFALGAGLGEALTRADWTEANTTLEAIAVEARALVEPGTSAEASDRGWREAVAAYFSAAGTFWNEADDLLTASLVLVGIFVLRMLVLPLVLLIAFALILQRVWRVT